MTGAALYAADHVAEGMLYGVLVGAPVPAGRVRGIDADDALAVPGVTYVLTHAEMPKLGVPPVPPASSARVPMLDDEIHYEGEPIAVVLAQSLEAAEYAASLVRPDIESAPFAAHPSGERAGAVIPRESGYLFDAPDAERGDVEGAVAGAQARHTGTYVSPSRHHNPMETSATLAEWRDDTLTLVDATQWSYGVRVVMCALFDLAPEQVRVRSPHTGGAFGCKGTVWPHQIIAAVAARVSGRPVRIALSRAQMYSIIPYQPQMVQTVTLAAADSGRLAAIEHESVNVTSVDDDFVEYATQASRTTYAAPAIRVSQRVQRANINLGTAMRAPVEGAGLWALGSAMNELAAQLRIDPIDLRLANYADVHPFTGQPWSSKKLRECYEQGARAFGWRRRPNEPERDGPWVVGQGMADCAMGTYRFASSAHVRLLADGRAVVQSGTQDIGTGIVTIMTQVACDVLGLKPDQVRCEIGDTELPEAGPTFGSSSTMGVGAAVMNAAKDVLAKLRERSGQELREAPGADALAVAMRAVGAQELVGAGSFTPQDSEYALHTFGAIFVEVGFDPDLGILRLRRAVGRYSVGRIVNPRTARAQIVGGIVWGWGKATMEASRHEERLGRWLSKNLAGVALPVNADIPSDIDVGFIDEVDEHAGPIGGKGIGEIAATGVDAAVADAVFHATGRRIRELPITPDKLV
ncbi:xanthine dehydrogenase family protein molybdopterin-binding subunit [Streptomyces spinoverrucosus]|uniref:xanthine dehydrogenase family protein molybdopterin-binding subunit n=1 Tax=Streptomyces spinoverrucosus TaxID=284043 RepID=UPI0018C39D12|nr:xanthine dehydrogenase family protein molybdopterin-binding subunit [Streptomyces spinoverrucosus]